MREERDGGPATAGDKRQTPRRRGQEVKHRLQALKLTGGELTQLGRGPSPRGRCAAGDTGITFPSHASESCCDYVRHVHPSHRSESCLRVMRLSDVSSVPGMHPSHRS